MSQGKPEEPLLPPWVMTALVTLGPLVAVAGIYYVLTSVLHVPGKFSIPLAIVLILGLAIYFGGRLYKPFHVDREGKCTARGAKVRAGCRHYIPGAKLGGGCGRLREDGRCRYVRG
ncbi:MAG: hypothetical protein JSV79_03460 [Armatimonadota bacterium]|nr:MAG: hypothetical protein JSV79_03460 [Armatimonadota bacterium]